MRAITILLIICSQNLWGAAHDSQTWVQLTGQGAFHSDSPYGYFLEAQSRYSSLQARAYESFARAGLTYKTAEWGAFTAGYLMRINSEQKNVEDRIWQQWLYKFGFAAWKLQFRWRQEQRNIHAFSQIGQRTRWLFRVHNEDWTWAQLRPYVASELLYNLNAVDPTLPAGLHQSRNFVGVTYTPSPLVSFDLAYLLVVSNRHIPADDAQWDTLWMTANFNL